MIKIRTFRNSDTSEIIRLTTTVVKEFLDYTDEDLQDLITDLSDIKKNYLDKGGNFIVCTINDNIIGTIALLPQKKHVVKLKRMYLYKAYRGKEHGSNIFNFAENWCKDNDFNKIILSTYPPFTGSKFYKKMGFNIYKNIGKKTFYEKYLETI
ncbi:GNAT family N-acetyltransferase [Patescibacteria group bacterium]|nr:GNAT family N-acetyltransferase [Patescibacteria group bacterium]